MKTRFLDNLSPFHTAHRNFDVPHRPDYCMTYYAWYMTRHAWSSSLAQWSARTVIDHQMFGNCAKYVLIKCHNMFGSMRCVLVGLAVKLLTSIVTFSCWCIGVLLYIVHTHTHLSHTWINVAQFAENYAANYRQGRIFYMPLFAKSNFPGGGGSATCSNS